MRKLFRSGLVLVSLIACVSLAAAQAGGQGGGGRRGGGFGQRGGGQRGGGGSELGLTLRKDVQADLAITDDQKTKLEALNTKQREARRAAGGGAGAGGARNGGGAGAGANGGTTVDREAMLKRMQEQRDQTRKDLAAILNESQMKRLGEISLQLQGNRALSNPEVQKQLGLSTEQTDKIKDLQTKMQEANRALRQSTMTREEQTAARDTNNKTFDTEVAKVLTADQNDKLKALQGKPFKADPAAAGGRRGGGGGGGN